MRKLFSIHISTLLFAPSLLIAPFLMVPNTHASGIDTAWYNICFPDGAVTRYTLNLTGDIGSSFNKSGVELPSKFSWNDGKTYKIVCACIPGQSWDQTYYSTFYKGNNGPTTGHAPGWEKANEYIDVRTFVAIWNQNTGVTSMHEVPFRNVSNYTSEGVCPNTELNQFGRSRIRQTITSGGTGRMDLYIRKPFVGRTTFSIPDFYTMFANNEPHQNGPAIATIGISVDITAPQSCEINAGQSISIPFNDIPQRNFVAAGKGVMPAGVVPQSKTLSLKCSNMDAYANLDMRFIGTADPNSTTDGFSTDNKDIAIAIEGPNGRLTPTTGKLPLQLDANQNGSVTIKTYPFSSTGLAPTVGKYSSIVTVRLDFR
ncbi:fimbrial protein [Providencia huaxiensis]|uniref:fimbrial protein n=1 Tax=Providencia TaxID=586 RepID=UPI00234A5717|nr:fimbrial protein [Providencia sp. PROV076]